MTDGLLGFAFAAGMVATVNPCGFALLPAYLSLFLGADPGERAPVGRALRVSAAMTLGFVVTFGLAGVVLAPILASASRFLPWITIVIGVGLVGLGIALLAGKQVLLRTPHLERGGRDGSFSSMFLFGVSYAVASLSCTIGPFLAATSGGLRSGDPMAAMSAFVAYGLGMGAVVTALTVATAFARDGVVRRLRRLLPIIPRVAGALLVFAGTYVAWYGWWERRILEDPSVSDPLVDMALGAQSRLASWMSEHGGTALLVIAGVVVITGVVRFARHYTNRAGGVEDQVPVPRTEPTSGSSSMS